jgi:hypothetical protein
MKKLSFVLISIDDDDNTMDVRSTARHDIHLQFYTSANALEIRAIQSPKCIV